MSGCTYKDCTVKRDGITHLFRYPVSNKLRCQQWLMNAHKLDIMNFNIGEWKNRLICQHHFKDEDFQNILKNRLKSNAVPTLDGPYCDSKHFSVINQNFHHDYSQMDFAMSDEIEIEEHDVLDNPDIKRIFPDLSVIKKEISAYEEGLTQNVKVKQENVDDIQEYTPIVEQQKDLIPAASLNSKFIETTEHKSLIPSLSSNSETTSAGAFTDSSLATHLRFKTFLDSLDDYFDITDNSCHSHSSTETQHLSDLDTKTPVEDYKNVCNNILILGTKPSDNLLKNSSDEIRQIKVVLKDVSTYLNASKQYCKKCFILFPNIDILRQHVNEVHSATKNTFKTAKSKNAKSQTAKYMCKRCNIKFSSEDNLFKHNKWFHRIDTNNTKTIGPREKLSSSQRDMKKANTNSLSNDNSKAEASENHYCFHCSECFESHNSLIEHLYEVINPDKYVSKKLEIKQNTEKNNVAIQKGDSANLEMLTCSICSFKSSNQKELDDHLKKCHINSNINETTSNKRNNIDLEQPDENTKHKKSLRSINNTKRNERRYTENIDSEKIESECYETDNDDKYSDLETTSEISSTTNNIQERQVFQCFLCSKYILYFKVYFDHMLKHNINVEVDIDKRVFDPQCRFCNEKCTDIKAYNKHILLDHSEKNDKKIKLDYKAFESVLFKCVKCNIFFLSANAAMNHIEHKEIFVNWNCSDCHRSFKVNDKSLHLQQHLTSENITAYTLHESALNRVLCKCLKCAVHFSEAEYSIHSATCELEAPNSVYCNICDILINKIDMDSHERNHKCKRILSSDFTIIESALLVNAKKNIEKKVNPYPKSKFVLTFCYTCNCFISGLSSTRKAHLEGRCDIISQRMCKICGLIFTNRGYISHKMLHDDVKNLSLQAFHFYDINTKKKIHPPMPKYPNCKICDVHFINKQVIKQHECNQQKYRTCNICDIKLTEIAFKLHMCFHNYKMSSAWKKIVVQYEHSDEENNAIDRSDSEKSMLPDLNITKQEIYKPSNSVFTCVVCHIMMDSYDKVVQHCHTHYGYKNIPTNDYEKTNLNDKMYPKYLKFDPFYFRYDNDVWLKHVFENISKEEIEKILKDSIYKYECRLILEEIQPGASDLIIYKCDSCESCVDPVSMFFHAGTTCKIIKKHPCSHCYLNFYCSGYREVHERVHSLQDIDMTSYKIVLFNKKEHRQFIKIMCDSRDKFILYQCRNCESTVEKLQRDKHQCYDEPLSKCPYCGLLLYDREFIGHLAKHKKVHNFDNEHIIVVMFGKLDVKKDDGPASSFSGTIYDLTFYKCEKCGLCLENKNKMTNHVCVTKSGKSICPKCLLIFLNKDLNAHLKMHANEIELECADFCSNIISFNSSKFDINYDEDEQIESHSKHNKTNNKEKTTQPKGRDLIYKCNCGLHFLEKNNAIKHSINCQPKAKLSRQNCFRCDLLFTPGELFNHLLKHHSNKKLTYNYDIVPIT